MVNREPFWAVPDDSVGSGSVVIVDVLVGWEVWNGTCWWVGGSLSELVFGEVPLISWELSRAVHELFLNEVVSIIGIVADASFNCVLTKHLLGDRTIVLYESEVHISSRIEPDVAADSMDTSSGNLAVWVESIVVYKAWIANVSRRWRSADTVLENEFRVGNFGALGHTSHIWEGVLDGLLFCAGG